MSETEALVELIASTSYDDLPDGAVRKSKEAILDYAGVALYGSGHEVGEIVTEYVDECVGEGDTPLLGRDRTGTPAAALANGAYGHAIDYDDTFESIVLHPTSPTFAAAYAASARTEVTGQDLLAAYAVGIETAYRIGHGVYPAHYDHGWHITGTVGTFGSAAAAASVLDLTATEVRHALGIAASSSSSLKKNFGSMTKPLHAGHAAQSGVRAALLAAKGFTADPDIFEGDLGYGSVMTPDGTYDSEILRSGIDDRWGVMDIGYKPYPSGVITHAAMDAMRELVEDHGLTPDEVDTVVATLDDAASEMLHHTNPENELQAKFSIEFCLAAVLRERDVGIHEFTDEYVADPATRRAMAVVERDFEPNLFEADFANYGARVTVLTNDGRELTASEKYAPGSPNNPLSRERLEAKFRECASTVLDESAVDEAAAAIGSLEEPGALERFTEATTE
ncbi:MmgE/PrpD family protein (plasmid) [Natrinema zhouii]|uniref:MmgE/PrpD family protein n=1 Tax=Natrinema zhouii TaxID=1710539 RepID=UPI001CFFBD3C|nr:MmgE/PrpD family protein [Natrinema zhouii]UHQ98576.1 MmgE/PrpD family protein [Natrinema zhouii]